MHLQEFITRKIQEKSITIMHDDYCTSLTYVFGSNVIGVCLAVLWGFSSLVNCMNVSLSEIHSGTGNLQCDSQKTCQYQLFTQTDDKVVSI